MDYSKYLVLYSGGADSTYFIETEPSARHLIHYESKNKFQTNIAVANANILNRYMDVVEPMGPGRTADGETNQIHALADTQMILNASIRAAHYGMSGVVVCFTKDDIGVDDQSILAIMRRAEPNFEILQPLLNKTDSEVRAHFSSSKLKYVSCMVGDNCGYCAKCTK